MHHGSPPRHYYTPAPDFVCSLRINLQRGEKKENTGFSLSILPGEAGWLYNARDLQCSGLVKTTEAACAMGSPLRSTRKRGLGCTP